MCIVPTLGRRGGREGKKGEGGEGGGLELYGLEGV